MAKNKKSLARKQNKANFKKTLLIGGVITVGLMILMYNLFENAF